MDSLSGSVTHLFHCEISDMFSQQQIYLPYSQAAPLMKTGDMNQRNAQMNITHKLHVIKSKSILHATKWFKLSFSGYITCQSDQWEFKVKFL